MRELRRTTYRGILDYAKDPANRILVILIGLAFLVGIGLSVNRVVIYMSDFNMFIDPGVDLKYHDKDPYWIYTANAYSPFFYSVMSIFQPFIRWFAVILWSILSIHALIMSMGIMHSLLPKGGYTKKGHVLIAPALLLFIYVDNMQLGQCNLMMLYAILMSAFYVHRKGWIKAAIAFGFAIAYKTTPFLLVGYYGLKGKFKMLALSLVLAFGFLYGVPRLFVENQKVDQQLGQWLNYVILPFSKGEKLKTNTVSYYHTNQSMEAFIHRHFTDFGQQKWGGMHDVLDPAFLSNDQAKWVSRSMKGIVLLLLTLMIWRTRNSGSNYTAHEVALFVAAILFISPVAWLNHYILLLPLMVVLVHLYFEQKSKGLLALLITSTVLLSVGVDPVLQSFSTHFLGGFILFIGGYVTIWKYLKT